MPRNCAMKNIERGIVVAVSAAAVADVNLLTFIIKILSYVRAIRSRCIELYTTYI